VDEKKADLLFKQAEEISDEEAEEIMREIIEEHGHSMSSFTILVCVYVGWLTTVYRSLLPFPRSNFGSRVHRGNPKRLTARPVVSYPSCVESPCQG
jgi:hypothetical protein